MKCTYFQNSFCQTCDLLDRSYDQGVQLKNEELQKLFPNQVNCIKESSVLNLGQKQSRSKAKFAVFFIDNLVRFGFYNSIGTPKILENCPLHSEGINDLLPQLKELLESCKIIPYDLKTKKGEIKYLLISKSENEFLVRFVLRSKESLDRLKTGARKFTALYPEVAVITANIQPIHQAIIEGEEELILTNKKVIEHCFDEFKLTLGARSFFQVTPAMAKKLYNALSEEVKADRPKSLIDLYCGVGAFSFYASRWCDQVVGVEISKEAIDCALGANLINHKQIAFYAMDVDDYLKSTDQKFEAVLVNPPRRGLNTSIINQIKLIDPKFIYYSSCNAITMQRDFEELKDNYNIRSLQLFDMFPFTQHFETLMCLVRK